MARRKQDEPLIDLHFKTRRHKDQRLRVVGIVCTATPDAEDRLRRAFDILLGLALGIGKEESRKEYRQRAPAKSDPTGGESDRP